MGYKLKKLGLEDRIIQCKNIEEASIVFNTYKNLHTYIKDGMIIFTLCSNFKPIKFLEDGIAIDVDYEQWFTMEEINIFGYGHLLVSFEDWRNKYETK